MDWQQIVSLVLGLTADYSPLIVAGAVVSLVAYAIRRLIRAGR